GERNFTIDRKRGLLSLELGRKACEAIHQMTRHRRDELRRRAPLGRERLVAVARPEFAGLRVAHGAVAPGPIRFRDAYRAGLDEELEQLAVLARDERRFTGGDERGGHSHPRARARRRDELHPAFVEREL